MVEIARLREDWHPNAAIEPGEQYLAVDVEDLPSPTSPRRSRRRDETDDARGLALPSDPQLTAAAALLRLVLAPGELDNLGREEPSTANFRFYALVWQEGDAGQPVAFVSEYDPMTVLRKTTSFFRFEGTLRNAPAPDFALDDRADLIITTDEIAVLSPPAFDHLLLLGSWRIMPFLVTRWPADAPQPGL